MRKWGLGLIPFVSVLFALVLFQNRERLAGTSSAVPTPVVVTPSDDSTENVEKTIPSGWETYTSSVHGFSIRYPSDVQVTNHPQSGIIFNKTGATQTTGSELFDGFTLTIRKERHTQNTLEEFVKAEHSKIQNEPATNDVTEIKPVRVSGISGYTFRVSALGDFDHIYLPYSDKEYLLLVSMTADPQNQGYQKTLDTMIHSLEVKK